jgi:uncharacterized MnhB-related membrane protein
VCQINPRLSLTPFGLPTRLIMILKHIFKRKNLIIKAYVFFRIPDVALESNAVGTIFLEVLDIELISKIYL